MEKKYLLMVDEVSMAILGRLIPSLQFALVEGMTMENNPNHMLLVSPIQKPAEIKPLESVKADNEDIQEPTMDN